MLTVLDEYTREALCVTVATKMGSAEVLDALYPLLINRGKPEYVRSDNGPEFTSSTFKEWLVRVGIQPIHIYPGSPLSAALRLPAGQRMGERLQRTLQWNPSPGSPECRMVHHHQAGPRRHQPMAPPIQPHPAPSCPRYASASARKNLSEPTNHWYKTRGLDTGSFSQGQFVECQIRDSSP
jgi:hypothetical protein